MILLAVGLLLLAFIAALIVALGVASAGMVGVDVLDMDLELPVWAVFGVGVVSGSMAMAGVAMLIVGVRRTRHRRAQHIRLRGRRRL